MQNNEAMKFIDYDINLMKNGDIKLDKEMKLDSLKLKIGDLLVVDKGEQDGCIYLRRHGNL